MKHSSSPSTPLSSASRSPYVSFFDLEKVFQCGCAADIDDQHESLETKPLRQALHQEESCDEEDIHIESARDYVERISKEIASMEKERRDVWEKPNNYSRRVSEDSQTSITTVFRLSTTSNSTINTSFPSLKHTASESTQETVAISDDEMSIATQDEETRDDFQHQPVSILRRKDKMGAISASTGCGVRFCPTTVFPDPNEIPVKRKRVKRIKKRQPKQDLSIFVPACEDAPLEQRRLERRAQQNQYAYLTSDMRSASSEMLMPSESFYVFR